MFSQYAVSLCIVIVTLENQFQAFGRCIFVAAKSRCFGRCVNERFRRYKEANTVDTLNRHIPSV